MNEYNTCSYLPDLPLGISFLCLHTITQDNYKKNSTHVALVIQYGPLI